MYEGTIEMKRAAKSPASDLLVHSLVKKYVEIDVNPAKTGARKTHTFLISIGKERKSAIHLILADVTMIPGKMVPPITLPRGYQDSLSNQFQN
jgi:hypothetical protein